MQTTHQLPSQCDQFGTGRLPDFDPIVILIDCRMWVIARIEAMLERIVDSLLEESEALTITLKSRAGISRRRAKIKYADGKLPEARKRDISFPGATAQEAWNFSLCS